MKSITAIKEEFKNLTPEEISAQIVLLSLIHISDDMGKVIGKQGRIAKAIRTVVKAAASRDDKKVIVDIAQ